MRRLLQLDPVPDGVFCYNDPVAIGAIKAIRGAGLDVPRDICVVGAGNVHYSDLLAVPLTTVDQGTSQTGRRAAALLLQLISSKRSLRPRKILLSPKLVIQNRLTGIRARPDRGFLHKVLSPAKILSASKMARFSRATA